MPFRSLGLPAEILQAIKDAGYTEPTPIQLAAIPEALAGRDLIGIAQTGTGKTAAFTLADSHPASPRFPEQGPLRRHQARSSSLPTRELALQIEENVRAYARSTCRSIARGQGLRRRQ